MIAYEVLLTTEPSFSNPSFKICFVCLFVLFYGRSILLYSPGWSAMHYIARKYQTQGNLFPQSALYWDYRYESLC